MAKAKGGLKKPETPEPVFIVPSPPQPTPYEKAVEKAKDPMMSTAGNPLAEEDYRQGMEDRIVRTNMERLHVDAKLRKGPNGAIYAGIMNQRFGGRER